LPVFSALARVVRSLDTGFVVPLVLLVILVVVVALVLVLRRRGQHNHTEEGPAVA